MTLVIVLPYNFSLFLSFLFINFVLLTYEIIQLTILGFKEYFDFWNIIDFVRILLTSLFLVFYYQGLERELLFHRLLL
jgi:hypothetical protein